MTTTIGSLDLNAFSELYNDSNQYFWFESNSSATYGAGAHVTLVPDTTFISNPTGQNILMNTDGFSVRNGLLPMMALDNDSLDFNVVDTTAGTYTTTATFTATGAQIGQSSGAHSVIDANGQRFYASDGATQLANIGYDEGINPTGDTSVAPYYTFGIRTGTVGNYSTAEAYNVEASGFASHAEGFYTTASGREAHAEGYQTTASGDYSHAEGWRTTASSNYSHVEGLSTTASAWDAHAEGEETTASYSSAHAEGYYTTASGWISHSGGEGTIAQRKSQYAIGAYNIADNGGYSEAYRGNYVFIIGNGTSISARSNALTVDWDGGIQMYLDSNGTSSSAATSGTDMDLFNAIYDLGWYSAVIV